MKRYFHFLKIHPHKNFIFDNQNLKIKPMFTPAELIEIKKLLIPENKIVILTHYNPDGDAIVLVWG